LAAIEPTANNPQLTFKARRIYVGNLPQQPPIDDKQLREFFDQAMRQAGLLDPSNSDGCCVSDVWISAEKQFAFVEVRTVADANSAMQLDGITLYGQALRVNRPSDYVPPPTGQDPQQALAMHQQAAAARIAQGIGPGMPGMPTLSGMPGGMAPMAPMGMGMPGMPPPGMGMPGMMPPVGMPGMMPPAANLKADLMQRTKKCRRVHIGNLPINVGLTPEALKSFVNSVMQQMFLTVKPGEPVIDSFVSGDGKFGFVEMRTVQEATNALSMTGADCFGRPIRVGKPADYVPPDGPLIQAAMGSGLLGTPGDEGVGDFQPGPDMAKATTVLLIKNMLSETELGDESECKEIAEDTIQKCNDDFGKVKSLIIVRPGKEGADADKVGKVFVEFDDIESCKKAATGLNHVKFDDRTVETDFDSCENMETLKALYPEQLELCA